MDEVDSPLTGNTHFLNVADVLDEEISEFQLGLESHRHDDIAMILVCGGLNQARLRLVLEEKFDLFFLHDLKTIHDVLRIESDLKTLALIIQIDFITRFTHVGIR